MALPHYDPKKILAPLDFSDLSAEALRAALSIAQHRRAELTALYVMETRRELALHGRQVIQELPPAETREQARLASERKLHAFLKKVGASNEVKTILKWGEVVEEILDVAETGNFELIVMGTHGRTGVKRLFMGSVAEQVIRNAPCPVLALRGKNPRGELFAGEEDGLVCAMILDGQGRGREIGWPEIRAKQSSNGILWTHLQRTGKEGKRWLCEESGLDPIVCEALLGKETLTTEQWVKEAHPRSIAFRDGLNVSLRGVNHNPGADPSDMVAIRVWIGPNRIITVGQRHLLAIDDIRAALQIGKGPRGPGDFIVMLADRLVERIGPALTNLQLLADELEEALVTGTPTDELRMRLGTLRRRAIGKKRHIVPQREALTNLKGEEVPFLDERHRQRLYDIADRISQQAEELEALRERAALIQDEISNQMSAQLNRTIYHLSVLAALFLPAGFITGLLGINMAGIPWADSPWAFEVVSVLLVLIVLFEVWLFRRLKWI